ncbi:MAG: DUF58 domain-containing protein [Polyangiaceae bacterium]|nr:DUF58 domain-containing protein [Polyangiaceae bacterium]
MHLQPTSTAIQLALWGILLLGSGILSESKQLTAWGCFLLVGVALARSVARLSVARARAAGFEMLWLRNQRITHLQRNNLVRITLCLRNRDTLPTKFHDLRLTHSPGLTVDPEISEGEIPPLSELRIGIDIRAHQLGSHGILGVILQTVRAPGLHTTPLSFTNPHLIRVAPQIPVRSQAISSYRQQQLGPSGRFPSRRKGQHGGFFELRDYQRGDPFSKIAWRASARQAKLIVLEEEDEVDERLWIIVDVSVELRQRNPSEGEVNSSAPSIDQIIESALGTAASCLRQGSRVGLKLVSSREILSLTPERGFQHLHRLVGGILEVYHDSHADRSAESDLEACDKALSWMQSINPNAADIDMKHLEEQSSLARRLIEQSPWPAKRPWAPTRHGQIARQLLLSFGIELTASATPELPLTRQRLIQSLNELIQENPRPSRVILFAEPSRFQSLAFDECLQKLQRRRIILQFPLASYSGKAPPNRQFLKDQTLSSTS